MLMNILSVAVMVQHAVFDLPAVHDAGCRAAASVACAELQHASGPDFVEYVL